MDSSSESERGRPSKSRSHENGGRTSSRRSRWNVELGMTSASSSSKSQPCNFDGYQGYNHSSMRLEMDLFMKTESSAATSSYSLSDKYSDTDVLILRENNDTGTITSSSSTEQASMVSDITHESLMCPVLPAQSPPPLQVMGCSGGYDPGRIPSSVFERSKGPTLVEWSIASNESLFSIHIGNVSFSKDRFLPLAGDLQKSKELGKIKKSIEMTPPLQDEGASNSPIAQLERNFRDNDNAAGVANAIELDEGNRYNIIKEKRGDSIVTQMPSLSNNQHDRSSWLPAKKNSLCPKPQFQWLRTIFCFTSNCVCPSCSCPSCSPACSHWPSCHCKCPSLDCKCMCPDCNCSWLAFCFRWPGCCRGCCSCCNSSSCCDWNCCSKGCCSCPSCGCCSLSFSCKSCCYSCFSCQKCGHCC